jgi:outer membrane lipoprotein-sorting protein
MRDRKDGFCLIGILCSVAIVFGLLPALSAGADPSVEKIQQAYQGLKDLKGKFVQKSQLKDLDRTDTFKGTFMIKLPAKMRWQYRGKDGQDTEIVINNDEMIIYQKKEKQAFKGRFDRDTYGQAPIALLGGLGNIEKEFDITKKGGKLLLKPKRPMGAVVSIEITPSGGNFPIGSLTIVDRHSNRIDITFTDITVNTGMTDAAFDFSLPTGVSMYEMNETQ